jgi:hypothetical protein
MERQGDVPPVPADHVVDLPHNNLARSSWLGKKLKSSTSVEDAEYYGSDARCPSDRSTGGNHGVISESNIFGCRAVISSTRPASF